MNCSDNWNATAERPPGEKDNRCFPGDDTVTTGTSFCGGEPYDPDFWVNDGQGYYLRHKVIFNLYAFDSMRSQKEHAPRLSLTRCDFKYFVAN